MIPFIRCEVVLMSSIEKLKEKFYSKPTRRDITTEEIKKLANYYNCIVRAGGNHQLTIFNPKTGDKVPLPQHDKELKPAYIRELQELFGDEGSKR